MSKTITVVVYTSFGGNFVLYVVYSFSFDSISKKRLNRQWSTRTAKCRLKVQFLRN